MDLLYPMWKPLLVSSLLLTLITHLFPCTVQGSTINDELLNDVIYNTGNDDTYSDSVESDMVNSETKRAQFSLNGELRSLAAMLYKPETEKDANRAHLLKLGKRNWTFPSLKFGTRMFGSLFGQSPLRTRSQFIRRRSQQLSVSGPLSALANMLAAEDRRRLQSESTHNKLRLLELGKRTDDSENGESKNDFGY